MYPKYIRSRIIVLLVKWVQICKWIFSRYFTEVWIVNYFTESRSKIFPLFWVTIQKFEYTGMFSYLVVISKVCWDMFGVYCDSHYITN